MKNNRKNRIVQLCTSIIPLFSTLFIAVTTIFAISKIQDTKVKEKMYLTFGCICMISGVLSSLLSRYLIYNQEILIRVAITGCLLFLFNCVFVFIQKKCENIIVNEETNSNDQTGN